MMDSYLIGFLCVVFAICAGILIGLSKWFDGLMKTIGDYLYND
jgi:ABC-type nitrate/sulfonate/bicarbonate transport system permease component